jgi:hypothetical protein
MPNAPSPAHGATGVSTTATLGWSASGATSYDVRFGTTNPPPQVSTAQAAASYAPTVLANATTYFWQVVAHSGASVTTGPIWSFTTVARDDIVIYASDIPLSALHGMWSTASDPTSAGGIKLMTPDGGWAVTNAPLADPTDYLDISFLADAGTPYTLWLRLQALNNSKYNDAVWAQFSDAVVNGTPAYALNSTAGLLINLATSATAESLNRWGWQNGAYWLSQSTMLTFATGGVHTLRIQVREDGVQMDQIVLSPTAYLNRPPGPVTNDSTIVPKP